MAMVEQYLNGLYPEDEEIKRALQGIREAGMPEISIAEGYGRLLTMLVKASRAKDILEIGALGGCSGIYLARGLEADGTLTSLELEPRYADLAREHVTAAGYGDQVSYRIGDAKQSLVQLEEEGKQFDFFFIDADKESYPIYLDFAIRLARPGAIIAGDNALLRGRVVDETKMGPSVQAMRNFNTRMATDARLSSTILPAFDGLALAMVKGVPDPQRVD